MHHIRANAESSVRNLLRDVAKRAGTNVLEAVDHLDDGSPVSSAIQESDIYVLMHAQIQLKVEINEEDGSAVLDFEGTGCEIRGNLNAPISVVHSAVIYCMRAMLDMDIPLNAGCLVPITGWYQPLMCHSRCSHAHVNSQVTGGFVAVSVENSSGVWRQCSHLPTDR